MCLFIFVPLNISFRYIGSQFGRVCSTCVTNNLVNSNHVIAQGRCTQLLLFAYMQCVSFRIQCSGAMAAAAVAAAAVAAATR